jgi:hypothetical protein
MVEAQTNGKVMEEVRDTLRVFREAEKLSLCYKFPRLRPLVRLIALAVI